MTAETLCIATSQNNMALWPQHQRGELRSRHGDGEVLRQQRMALDQVAIMNQVEHDLQRCRSTGRYQPLWVQWTAQTIPTPALSRRSSSAGIVIQTRGSLGRPI